MSKGNKYNNYNLRNRTVISVPRDPGETEWMEMMVKRGAHYTQSVSPDDW